MPPSSSGRPRCTPSFRTEQADFLFRIRSCECVGLRRETSAPSRAFCVMKSLFSPPHTAQFSTFNPRTRRNSRSFFVTSVNPAASKDTCFGHTHDPPLTIPYLQQLSALSGKGFCHHGSRLPFPGAERLAFYAIRAQSFARRPRYTVF